jgi:hypothetical protein
MTFIVTIIASDEIMVLEIAAFTHSYFLVEQGRALNAQQQHTHLCVCLVFFPRYDTQLLKHDFLQQK